MVIHPLYYDACDVSCDVIYCVIAVRARRMVCIFFLPYLGKRSKSDPGSYELFCLQSPILSFPKVLQISSESPCIFQILFLHIIFLYIFLSEQTTGLYSHPTDSSTPLSHYLFTLTILLSCHLHRKYSYNSRKTPRYDTKHYFLKASKSFAYTQSLFVYFG